MIGRLLLFRLNDTCYDSVNHMVDSLEKELRLAGIEYDEINVSLDKAHVLNEMNNICYLLTGEDYIYHLIIYVPEDMMQQLHLMQ